MQQEKWIAISGYGDRYEVSDYGNVRSKDMFMNNMHGGQTLKRGRILKPFYSGKKYQTVRLCWDGKHPCARIHRLVAFAFVKNLQSKPHVNHIDGNKQNNKASNLEWCTNQENQIHAIKNGLSKIKKGQDSHRSKLTEIQAKDVLIRTSRNETLVSIAKMYGVTSTAILHIKKGKTWSHLNNQKQNEPTIKRQGQSHI